MVTEQTVLSTLIDSIPALVAYIDSNMILQFCNQPFKDWFSLGDDVAGKSFPLVAGEQIFDQLQRHMGKVLVGERAHFQMSISRSNGLHYLEATLSPEFDERKRVRGFIFHSSDITEKNKTERALKDYFENASIGLHWADADGVIIWANPAELKMLGYTAQEYVGHHISKFYAGEHPTDHLLNDGNQQDIKTYNADLLCKDGSIRNVAINSTTLWDGDQFVHIRRFTMDVTEQTRVLKAMKESEERFKMMASLVPLVIWTTDAHGDFNFLSVKWQELTGKTVQEGLGRLWHKFIHPDDKDNIVNSWKQSHYLQKPFEAKFRLLNSTGKYSIMYANSNIRFNASGEFAGYIGILQDISMEENVKYSLENMVMERTGDLQRKNFELEQAEKELQKKNAELEEKNNQLSSFAHITSHDLQEPLRKIQILSSLLFEVDGNKFSEKGKDLHNRIYRSTDRMRNLIQDLLAYSKSNQEAEKFEQVDMNSLLAEVITELEIKIAEKNAIIENQGLPTLRVIRFQFHQLLLNLLGNALKFTKTGTPPHIVLKTSKISAKDVQSCYQITISDNGIGFEDRFSKKIFEMFNRLHGHTEYEGTGIGLAIVKKIIENHKGKIIATGIVNGGATFDIFLPLE